MTIASGSLRTAARRAFIEPRRPRAIRESAKAPWLAVGAVCIGAFMGQLDASIVNLAYHPIERAFHASLASATWVGLAYLLVLISLVTAVGRLADVWGRKLLYTYGFGVFVLGSALCGFAPSLGVLIAFRVLQAIGAAMMQANSVAIIAVVLPRERLGRGIGLQGAAQALGLALGPTVGGLLVASGGWRLVFLVNVPVGIIGIGLARALIPRSQHLAARTPFDWRGGLLLPPAVGCVLAALSLGHQIGWASPTILALLALSLVAGIAFVHQERRVTFPLLDLSVLRLPGFSTGVGGGLMSYLVLFGAMFLVPLGLVAGLGLSPVLAGLEITVMPIVLGIVAPVAGRLADRIGPRPLTTSGMAASAAGLVVLAAAPASTPLRIVALVLLGLGLGLFTPANNSAVMASVPAHSSGLAGGLINMTRGVGAALGLALTTLVLEASGGITGGGFRPAAAVLAACAVLAGLVSSAGSAAGRRPLRRDRAGLTGL